MSVESSARQALDHYMLKGAIADVVRTIYQGGVPKDVASSIVNEFAVKAINYALSRPVQPPNLTATDWKTAWAESSLAVFMVTEDNLTMTYALRISSGRNQGKEIYRLLIQLATALSGISRLIHCGLDPKILLR